MGILRVSAGAEGPPGIVLVYEGLEADDQAVAEGKDRPAAVLDLDAVSTDEVVPTQDQRSQCGSRPRNEPVCPLNDRIDGENDNDELAGFGGADDIDGGPGNDTLNGGAGNDTLQDNFEGDDRLVGGGGDDEFTDGPGNDTIESRDGVSESVNCGSGFDTVEADLLDTFSRKTGCESIQRSAIDDGLPGRILARSVRIRRNGKLALRLRCPRRAKVTCRGKLRLTHTGRRRTLAAKRYSVRRGRTRMLRLKLSPRAARRAVARKAIVVRTRERGVSKKGPRSTVQQLRVRRSRR